MLKKILIGIAILIALPFVVAIFIPKSYTVSVSETINQPKPVVYDYVRMLDNQKEYSVWVLADPNLKPEIIGTDGTVGAVQKWNSKLEDVGEGEQKIVSLTADRIDVDLLFIRPFQSTAKAAMIVEEIGPNQTKITDEFYGTEEWPMNLPVYLFARKMIAKSMSENLTNIKNILEKK